MNPILKQVLTKFGKMYHDMACLSPTLFMLCHHPRLRGVTLHPVRSLGSGAYACVPDDVFMGSEVSAVEFCEGLGHELEHCLQGTSDPHLTKQEYMDLMMDNEVRAVVVGTNILEELWNAGCCLEKGQLKHIRIPKASRYSVFSQWVWRYKTSTTNELYEDYYSNWWEKYFKPWQEAARKR